MQHCQLCLSRPELAGWVRLISAQGQYNIGIDTSCLQAPCLSICLWPVQHALLSVDGLISYMRSDSSSLDDDSAHQLCEAVAAIFGPEFVTDPPKQYK